MLLDRRHTAQAVAARHWELSSDAARKRPLCSGAGIYRKLSSGVARQKVPCSVGAGLRTPFALRPRVHTRTFV